MEPDLIKRAARAILREELRALRKRARDAEANAQAFIKEAAMDRDNAQRSRDEMAAKLSTMRTRTAAVLDWGKKHRTGDMTVQVCAQYISGDWGGSGTGYYAGLVSPFERWQVLPALK